MDHTPASLFDAYEQDFVHLVESVKTKLDEIRDQRGGRATVCSVAVTELG